MHRTTTTATLLVTVAVSALTGCVTVQRPPASGPAAAPARPPAAHPDGNAGPGAVQAPAREALERVGPSGSPAPAKHPSAQAPAPQRRLPPPSHSPGRRPEHPTPRHPTPRHQRPPRAPHTDVPDLGHPAPGNADVCALGREYGHWAADSPQARICGQAYSR
ncbi:hypothetical protein ACF061_31990 [Streptomyces sp. NPDC015220]|uniref:hypothetical protein n=1 Tax=Streptomyces sp. NPDC015220 TaxID=3364947 RepID=UPI0036F613EF